MEAKKNICIIPARGGSKRIPKKNIKSFLGKPIIAYSIEAALKSNLFDEVMVSTDDNNIANIALEYGAKVPFNRSQQNANDHAVLADVISEVLNEYANRKITFEYVCCILPTAPFITNDKLQEAFSLLKSNNHNSVLPVIEYPFPIQRSLKMNNNVVEMVQKEHVNTRSQDLEPRYHDSGQFYWLEVNSFLKEEKLFTKNTGAIVINHLEAQDIDTEIDWKLAELKFKLLFDEEKNNI